VDELTIVLATGYKRVYMAVLCCVVLCRAAADYAVQCQDESCARGGLACVSLSERKLDALASHNLGTARLGEAGRRLAAHSHTQPHTASHKCSNNLSGLDNLFVFELITLFVCPGACQTSLVGEAGKRLVRGWRLGDSEADSD
jgi:hypothetical protein